MTGRRLQTLILLIAVVASSCADSQHEGAERWAILAIENLSPDPSLDWVGPAISDILAEELMGVPSLDPQKVSSRSEGLMVRATRVVSGYFTFTDGLLDLRLVVEDPKSQQIATILSAQAPPAEIVSAGDSLALQVSPDRRTYGTSDIDALRPYALAIGPGRPADYDGLLQQALDADPGFSQAHLALAQVYLSRGDADRVEAVAEEALSGEARFDEIDQARLELIRASALTDEGASMAAMERLATLTPADSDLSERIGGARLSSRDYAGAAAWLRRAAETEPSHRQLWNLLGYAEAWKGDLDASRSSLARYREVAPDDPNALDSLGEVHYHLGSFAEAARYFLECDRMEPDFRDGSALWKAAQATWRAGDLTRADQLIEQYAVDRGSNDLTALQHGRWLYLTGRTRQATAQLEQLASRDTISPQAAASVYTLLAVWAAEEADGADRAVHFAAEAQRVVESEAGIAGSPLVSLLTESGAAPAELEQSIEAAFPDARRRNTALGQLLFFHRHYVEAIPVLRELYAASAPFTEDEFSLQLGYSLAETGSIDEARELLSAIPVVQPGQESLFHEITLRRVLLSDESR